MTHIYIFFFFNDTATTEIYTLSLHDALPICTHIPLRVNAAGMIPIIFAQSILIFPGIVASYLTAVTNPTVRTAARTVRSEEHTSELQSRQYLVCRLLLEKKKKTDTTLILYEE